MTSRLRQAQFKENLACVEDIDYQSTRNLKKKAILWLSQNHWIENHQNILLTGPTGVGKSFIAQALGNKAMSGVTVLQGDKASSQPDYSQSGWHI